MVNIDLSNVKLRFAMRGDARLNIREFDDHRGVSKGRPTDLTCPECAMAVFPVLSPSRQITDHFRHESESDCSIRTSNESAVHFNAKAALAQEMEKFHSFSLIYHCPECCAWKALLEIECYDSVRIEIKTHSRRPDVSLWFKDQTVGAAEIFYTHAVSAEKKSDLDSYGFPWFEIPAQGVHRANFSPNIAGGEFRILAGAAGVTHPDPNSKCYNCRNPWHWVKNMKSLPSVYRLYARKLNELTDEQHGYRCRGRIEQGEGVVYCALCGAYSESVSP